MPDSSTYLRRALPVTVLAVAALAIGFLLGGGVLRPGPNPDQIAGLLWPNPKTVGPFSLDDGAGGLVDVDRLRGRWTLFAFGFTHCPDVCPTTLTTLAAARTLLAADGIVPVPQVIFVSVDPDRDTPAALAAYVAYFDRAFIGASGPLPDLEALTGQLGIAHAREAPDANGDYDVAHSAAVLLVDPRTRLVGVLSSPLAPGETAARIVEIQRFVRDQS